MDYLIAGSSITAVDDNTRKTAVTHYFVDVWSSEYKTVSALFAADASTPQQPQVRQDQISLTQTQSDGGPRNKKLRLLDSVAPASNGNHSDVSDAQSGQALQLEITAYLGQVAVSDEEKLLP